MKNRILKRCSLLLCVVLLIAGSIPVAAAAGTTPSGSFPKEVYVGGMPFGVKFYTEGILVVGFCDVDVGSGSRTVNPARDAGVRVRDVILKINGEAPANAAAFTEAVEAAGGKPLTLRVRRTAASGRKGDRTSEVDITVTPVLSTSEGRYKTGLWVRDSGAGIGTVTFLLPGSLAFAGLGHGICDGDTGELVTMRRGQVTDVTVSGVERGAVGAPGAIKGYFTPGKAGTLVGNTECGVFGIYAALPPSAVTQMRIGHKNEVREGDATILCTLDDGKIGAYSIKITSVDVEATGSKCFTISVTDPALIEKTGGIVQGMSGSPVIQNGKLVGAVTHVLIHDPTAGYGIFVDHMLRDMPELLR